MPQHRSRGTDPARANTPMPLRTGSDRKREIRHEGSAVPSMMAPVSRVVAVVVVAVERHQPERN